jgi:L-2-hydroxyglutarate oxidase
VSNQCDVTIIGGGIVGLATAMALSSDPSCRLLVLEAEGRLAAHQTGHNSGVIHSGLYYKPGSAKARTCAEGRELLYRFCRENGLAHERCGKVVVATHPGELPALAELERRGRANGLRGLRRLDPAGLRELEPHADGIAGLFVAETGIVDYRAVAAAYAAKVEAAGGRVVLNAAVLGCRPEAGGMTLATRAGDVRCRYLINCAGLHSDRVARLCGAEPGVQIIPFRGEYYRLRPGREHLVRNLIYPVPDARFPFLGVHFTRMVGGGVEAGPNAVLAFSRHGYHFGDVRWGDLAELARFRGFWRMAARFWRTGLEEFGRSLSRRLFWKSLRRLVPELRFTDLERAGAGVRAQAVEPGGRLVDDFHIVQAGRTVHVLNSPSPAATASISIGQTVAALARRTFGLS